MRLLAPEGKGHPVLRGVEVKPEDDGTYHVNPEDGRMLVDTHGYIDADAPAPKPKTSLSASKQPSAELRAAVLTALDTLGVTIVPGAPDEVLAKAIREAALAQNVVIANAVARTEKETEERVLRELAADAEKTKKK
jgi:hypothetical protein